MHKTNCSNITNKLYGKDIFIKLYNKTLLQRFTVKVWRNGLVYLILRTVLTVPQALCIFKSADILAGSLKLRHKTFDPASLS